MESHFEIKKNIKETSPLRQPPHFLLCKKTLVSIVEAMSSKVILMMPNNQSRVKQSFKFQDSRFKNQDSRKVKIKIQDSRFMNHEKTQSR